MRLSRGFLTAALLGMIWMLTSSSRALAQDTSGSQIVINGSHLAEQGSTQSLSLFFTVIDANGQPVPNATLSQATILVNGTLYPATLGTPNTPLSLALLFDISGSMGPAGSALRAAATQAIGSATPGTIFSIYTFNDKITQLLTATPDANAAKDAIGKITGFSGGTCIYDAADQAITALRTTNANGRNAVLLFTDGKDELANGNVCSKITLDGLVTHASQQPGAIPIYTIGLRGSQPIAEAPLTTIASATHGLAAFGSSDKLTSMFQSMITALNSQHLAQATVCAPQGTQQAVLNLKSSVQSFSQPATFSATTNCVPIKIVPTNTATPTNTPVPLSLSLSPFQFSAQKEQLTFQVGQAGVGAVSKYRIQIKYKDTNIQIAGSFGDFLISPNTPVTINTQGIRTASLVIMVQAIDANNVPIGPSVSSEVLLDRPTATPTTGITPSITPTLTLTPAPLAISGFQVNTTAGTLIFTVGKPGDSAIKRYHIHVSDKATNIQIPGQFGDFTIDVTDQVTIPISGISDGQLLIDLQPLDSGNQPVGPSSENSVVIQHPTATATPPVSFAIQSIALDNSTQSLIVQLSLANIRTVTGYTVIVVDKAGLEKYHQPYNGLPGTTITIPANTTLDAGDYTIRVDLSVPNQTQPVSASQTITYAPPPKSLLDNPLLVIVLALIAIVALIVIFLLIIRVLFSGRSRQPRQSRGRATIPAPMVEGTMVDPIGAAAGALIPNPNARLTILEAVIMPTARELTLRNSPFYIGKNGGNVDRPTLLDFDDDSAVSRNHATITHEGGDRYTLTDTSRNGIKVADQQIPPGQPYPLPIDTDVLIDLSSRTKLKFRVSSNKVGVKPITPAPSSIPAASSPVKAASPASAPPTASSPQALATNVLWGAPATASDPMGEDTIAPSLPEDATYIGTPEMTAAEWLQQPLSIPAGVNAELIALEAQKLSPNTVWKVSKSPFTIGRNTGDGDAKLFSQDISRKQAAFIFDRISGRFAIFDQGSAYGTFLDGNHLDKEVLVWLEPDRTYELRFDRQQATRLSFRYHHG